MSTQITPKQLANEIGVSPKRLRSFMRKLADDATKNGNEPRIARVGQGNRYALSAADAKAIKGAWAKAHASKASDATSEGENAEG